MNAATASAHLAPTATDDRYEVLVDGKLVGYVRKSGRPSAKGVQWWIAEARFGSLPAAATIEPSAQRAANWLAA
jgi:hypothetical protein